ncbi:MAG TPA: cbb3-type cytochrome c oxidase subunit I, partial [Isosphaeraceae bacterium]|nr:cbb3-type cytochrome c oxidase subunit I [Isosphaeraceae bacterium]
MNAEHADHGPSPAADPHAPGRAGTHGHDPHVHEDRRNVLQRYVFSTDHKVIGIQFLFSGLIFFVLGGLLAMAIRWQLAWPWAPVPILSQWLWSDPSLGYRMPPEFYNKLFTMHASVMIFFVIIPLLTGAFGNFLIPLMIGARDMAFPKLNMFSYWAMPFAFIAILYSFVVEGGSAEAGWTSYPILSVARWATPGSLNGQTWWLVALLFVGISSLMGSINYITTIIMLRAPGMKLFRMPMSVWALFITAILQAFALPVLTSALVMQLLDRTAETNFFQPSNWTVANAPPVVGGGQTLMWQHLFWFYSHPAVYIMILPGMGVVSELIAAFTHKRVFGYNFVAASSIAIAVLGFLVWGHHMFTAGISVHAALVFSLLSFLVAIPSAIKVFNWSATLYKGSISLEPPMLYALGFMGL